jgi:hypothetical protein
MTSVCDRLSIGRQRDYAIPIADPRRTTLCGAQTCYICGMSQITLTMAPSSTESDLYPLGHVGSLRWERSKRPFVASAQAGMSHWRFAQTGSLRQNATASDADGARIGTYRTRGWTRSGGTIVWNARELKLRPTALLHIGFSLDEDKQSLAELWSDRYGNVVVGADDLRDIDAGPLLLAAFVVRAQILCTVPAGI